MPITALPTPPTRADPTNFAARADAFVGALPTFQSEANSLQTDVNNKQTAAQSSANAAAASAVTAGNSQTAAAASAASAAASAGVTAWNPATNYAGGVNVYDTTDLLTYRRKVAGTTATRPGLDATNWQLIAGDATLGTNQTFTGVKTFSQTIVGTVQNATALTDGTVLCPPGMVMHYTSSAAPNGWLKANGAAVSRTTFAALFAVVGTTFGAGDGSTTFNVPDLRAEFVRSWADGKAGPDTVRAFGSLQAEDVVSHLHGSGTLTTVSAGAHTHTYVLGSGAAAVGAFSTTDAVVAGGTTSSAGAHTHTMTGSTASTGGTETRPRNIALLACIKF